MQPDSESVVQIAHDAGMEILRIYEDSADLEITTKADSSPLTKADLAAHATIQEGLRKLDPDIPLVSEEGRDGDPRTCDHAWLVDPLDGTKEFIKRNGMFTVNIALMSRNESRWRPVFGVVFWPLSAPTWGWGAAYPPERRDGERTRRIKVSQEVGTPVRLVASGSHRGEKDEEFASNLGPHDLVRMGSSLKACVVAEGSADLYPRFGPTSCWDIAAAHAIVEAAGGIVVGPEGETLDYDIVDDVLNPFFLIACNTRWNAAWARNQD
ncbi:MAG: 3'(2'),5'-bisphosphate nucleotidase CysQ [Candidatus Thermoplasmatota archaeon]|nr:3'(2'),5'-bisphosphate nucleotidase CysQ [Candidatus Thermoplasmatota archaeon]